MYFWCLSIDQLLNCLYGRHYCTFQWLNKYFTSCRLVQWMSTIYILCARCEITSLVTKNTSISPSISWIKFLLLKPLRSIPKPFIPVFKVNKNPNSTSLSRNQWLSIQFSSASKYYWVTIPLLPTHISSLESKTFLSLTSGMKLLQIFSSTLMDSLKVSVN